MCWAMTKPLLWIKLILSHSKGWVGLNTYRLRGIIGIVLMSMFLIHGYFLRSRHFAKPRLFSREISTVSGSASVIKISKIKHLTHCLHEWTFISISLNFGNTEFGGLDSLFVASYLFYLPLKIWGKLVTIDSSCKSLPSSCVLLFIWQFEGHILTALCQDSFAIFLLNFL